MSTSERIAPGVTSHRPLSFTFDGVKYQGYEGDTLASALLANGVFVLGRSFKLHRPRGVIASGADEPNAIVQLEPGTERSEPDLKATQVELYDGLTAASVNRWPSAQFDVGAVLGVLKPFLPAGFYYKTFMWPNWHLFEPSIRKAAGLGVGPTTADPDKYDTQYVHSDVLIVGAGPAGLFAADLLSTTGANVILVDENPMVGTSFTWTMTKDDGRKGVDWAIGKITELSGRPNVRVMRRTIATGYYEDNAIALVEKVSEHVSLRARHDRAKQRLWVVRTKHVIIATGAHERPIVFGNNDRPGVMLANAAATYASYFGVCLGRFALAFVNNDRAYQAVFATHDNGTRVGVVVDNRKTVNTALVAECRARKIELHLGSVVLNTGGRKRIKSAAVRSSEGKVKSINCDLMLMSGGWSPVVHLYSQNQGKLRFDGKLAMFRPDSAENDLRCTVIGAANGTFGLEAAIDEAKDAAGKIAQALGRNIPKASTGVKFGASTVEGYDVSALWRVEGSNAPAWVDFQNDVTESDVRLAARENFVSVEHLKRYTTMGMASDQGKTSNVNALALLGAATKRSPDQVGTTKFRPPYSPVTIGAMVGHNRGDLFHPRRYLSAHQDHLRLKARMLEYGAWTRPIAYPIGSETDEQAWNREVEQVRRSVGVFDGSPLGKVEVKGPDAVAFVNAMYANELGTLAIGKCRYSLILNEGGGILDDGVISRLAEDHYLVGTSSAGTQRVLEIFELWRASKRYRVAIMNASDQWATYAVTGPDARRVMQQLPFDFSVAKEDFPHMSFKVGTVGGVPCRVARVSFTGEVTFEVSVPAHYGASVFRTLVAKGALPFGVEALMVMRVEKGFIHVGADTDPATTLSDVGMGAFGSKKTKPFVGQRAAQRSAMADRNRLQLVGIECVDHSDRLRAGGHLLNEAGNKSEGHITSCVWSPTLKKYVALAVLRDGTARLNEKLKVYDDGKYTAARVVGTCFVDPDGDRLKI
jgi:sarcosine oxidase subunit alpha